MENNLIYYELHKEGYKFCDNLKELTRPQIAYLGKAREIVHQKHDSGGEYDNNIQTNKQSLKEKYRQRVNK